MPDLSVGPAVVPSVGVCQASCSSSRRRPPGSGPPDEVHARKRARVAELQHQVTRSLDARRPVGARPASQRGRDLDVRDGGCQPLSVRFAGQHDLPGIDGEIDRISLPPPQQRIEGEADLYEQEVGSALPGRQRRSPAAAPTLNGCTVAKAGSAGSPRTSSIIARTVSSPVRLPDGADTRNA